MKYKSKKSGFAALISVLIIGTILLLTVLDMSQDSFLNDSNILNALDYQKAKALSHSCADEALLRLAEDPSYVPNPEGDTFTFVDDACTILSISSLSNIYTIKTSASVESSISDSTMTAVLSQNALSISTISEN